MAALHHVNRNSKEKEFRELLQALLKGGKGISKPKILLHKKAAEL